MKGNSFKPLIFISAIPIFGIFTFITLLAAGAVDEGTDGNSALIQALAKLFYIFRFPMHTIFFNFMAGSFFFLGLGINCLFYSFITERIVSALSKRN